MTIASRTARTVEISRALGFDLCGVAPAEDFPELAHLGEWLERGHAGQMRYLHDPRRRSPALAMQSARSVIVCALNYNTAFASSTEGPNENQTHSQAGPQGWISRYAWGDDYHEVLGKKLEGLIRQMRQEFPEPFEARAYVDTGPIIERVAAKYAGLGWLAKNTCLIHEELGSWLFLGAIVTTLDLATSLDPAELPAPDLCGNCSLCIDACPTGAIVEPYVLDARRCISYLTIELRGSIPEEFRKPIGRHVFGCDICQDVCPWNRRGPETAMTNFQPRQREGHSLFSPDLEWLVSLTEEEFRAMFRRSPVKRTKWRGLVRNACIAIGNSALRRGEPRYDEICARLAELAAGGDALLAEHARWALDRLGFPGELPPPQAPTPAQAPDGRVVPPDCQR
ncbi:MAG TPA: tRNA epoxyqueuosine(34) reductase QueG [Candidatus Dormibacteraeota bacterium]|nr:tRNA epoxyqueuosine(34) reductase QueG [Candidatus Dormibacteraeota bacterium]